MALSSDEAVFGGYENASKKYNTEYQTQEGTYDNRPNSFQVTGSSDSLHALRHLFSCCGPTEGLMIRHATHGRFAAASCGVGVTRGLDNQE